MKGYRIDAYFRDKAGRELHRKCPIWTGHADDAKAAIKQAHAAIAADCKASPRVDSISIQAKGEDGESVMTREFAEDFTIGYGASALDGSNLAGDGIKHDLTPEQEAAAHERVKKAAVDALIGASPKIAEELRARTHERQLDATAAGDDGFGGFFDSMEKPKNETVMAPSLEPLWDDAKSDPLGDVQRAVREMEGTSNAKPFRGPSDPNHGQGSGVPGSGARHTVSAGPGCDKSIRDCQHKFNNLPHYGGTIGRSVTPCPHTLGDSHCGAQPLTRPPTAIKAGQRTGATHVSITRPAREAELRAEGTRIANQIRDGIDQTTKHGRTVERVVVAARDVERLARAFDCDPSQVPGKTIGGVPIELGADDNQPPQISSRRRDKPVDFRVVKKIERQPIVVGRVLTPSGVVERVLSREEERKFRAYMLGQWDPA